MHRSIVGFVALSLFTPAQPPSHAAGVVVTGRVTVGGTGTALQGAQVSIAAPLTGAITAADGNFRLVLADSLRGREVQLHVRMIGYSPHAQSVRLDRDSVYVSVALSPSPLQLESVVVTGTAAATPSVQLGNSVATVGPEVKIRGNVAQDKRARRRGEREDWNTEAYAAINENPFVSPREAPRSTFGIDVDRASYANVRRYLTDGQLPPRDAVRLEELVNYFPYDYAAPEDGRPVSVVADVAEAPWAPTHRLVRVALAARTLDAESLPPSNLVFLIDVSGSMSSANKLPLLKRAFHLLVDQLREDDHVAIVVYAGNAGLVLPSTPGSDKRRIHEAIEVLEAGGSTAGGAGIRLAYQVAKENFLRGGNNRIILATDGDFNIGVSSDAEMEQLIEEKRKDGTFLTVLGFGMGNYKDSKLETIADKGNGNYAYIDTDLEARKVFVHELGGTLVTVAKDVKLQIEFNPTAVKAYRLLGYENRLLRDVDFNDDRKDAGDMGAGHTVTALYEVIPVWSDDAVRDSDPLRYQRGPSPRGRAGRGELLYVKLRYKEPDASQSRLLELAVVDRDDAPSPDFRFAAAVAELGLLLRDSEHKGSANAGHVISAASASLGSDPYGYRSEFVRLARTYRTLALAQTSARR